MILLLFCIQFRLRSAVGALSSILSLLEQGLFQHLLWSVFTPLLVFGHFENHLEHVAKIQNVTAQGVSGWVCEWRQCNALTNTVMKMFSVLAFAHFMVENGQCPTDAPLVHLRFFTRSFTAKTCQVSRAEEFPLSSPQNDFLPPVLKMLLVSRQVKLCIIFMGHRQSFCRTGALWNLPEGRGGSRGAI